MTLKEKFEEVNILDYRFKERDLDSKTFYVDAEKCEKIADEFAIGFAEWCQYRCVQKEDLKSQLEIYKTIIKNI